VAVSTNSNIGRHVFGLATFASGIVTLVWHNSQVGHQTHYLILAVAIAQVAGGVLIQFRTVAKAGALILGAAYLVTSIQCVPQIISAPQVYNNWGNFFEQFSQFTGAGLVYASLASIWSPRTLCRIGCILLGICTVSFALEQVFYLGATVSFVPKWIPPSRMFWAIATTVFFALAALALISNIQALLAARLLTIMIVSFGVLVWAPILVAHAHDQGNWSETAENYAIAGAVWILADLLKHERQ
jgi:hypothetical protein